MEFPPPPPVTQLDSGIAKGRLHGPPKGIIHVDATDCGSREGSHILPARVSSGFARKFPDHNLFLEVARLSVSLKNLAEHSP